MSYRHHCLWSICNPSRLTATGVPKHQGSEIHASVWNLLKPCLFDSIVTILLRSFDFPGCYIKAKIKIYRIMILTNSVEVFLRSFQLVKNSTNFIDFTIFRRASWIHATYVIFTIFSSHLRVSKSDLVPSSLVSNFSTQPKSLSKLCCMPLKIDKYPYYWRYLKSAYNVQPVPICSNLFEWTYMIYLKIVIYFRNWILSNSVY